MVKIGFISEGKADKIILNSERFKKFLFYKFNISYSEEEIIYGGGKSAIKENFRSYIMNLTKKNVDHIFIMIDQDDKEEQKKNRKYKPVDCPLIVVNEISGYRDNRHYLRENQIFVIMTREMEAWFLADEKLNFNCFGKNPEDILNPSELVAAQLKTTSHGRIAYKLKDVFSIDRAAENSPSARRFLNKLEQISKQ